MFARVKDIKKTGPLEVTIDLTEPDYWLRSELSGPPGVVVEKAFVEKAGEKYGTVDGGAMCTGPYKLDSWKTGEGVTLVKNDALLEPVRRRPLVADRRSRATRTTPRSRRRS